MTAKNILPFVMLLGIFAVPLQAQEIIQFDDAQKKQRYQDLLETTRCLVCQNQSLADSGAGLAGDLRIEIENMVRDGKSDEQIVEFLVTRYGDFVLYKPPFRASTFLLWSAPILLLIIFFISMFIFFRKKNNKESNINIDDKQRLRAAKLLSATKNTDTGE